MTNKIKSCISTLLATVPQKSHTAADTVIILVNKISVHDVTSTVDWGDGTCREL